MPDNAKNKSQPTPEMDYEKLALSAVHFAGGSVLKLAAWLRAHDARVPPSVAGTERLIEIMADAARRLVDEYNSNQRLHHIDVADFRRVFESALKEPSSVTERQESAIAAIKLRVGSLALLDTIRQRDKLKAALKQIVETVYDVLPENLGTAMDKITELAESALKESNGRKTKTT